MSKSRKVFFRSIYWNFFLFMLKKFPLWFYTIFSFFSSHRVNRIVKKFIWRALHWNPRACIDVKFQRRSLILRLLWVKENWKSFVSINIVLKTLNNFPTLKNSKSHSVPPFTHFNVFGSWCFIKWRNSKVEKKNFVDNCWI